jgi:hypothetical protein
MGHPSPVNGFVKVTTADLAANPSLHLDRAAHHVDDAGELDQEPIAGGLDDAPAVLLDLGIGELAPQPS